MTSTTGRSAEPAPRTGGFTLFELVLVMLILSMVMALAAPSLRGFVGGRKSADAAAQIIALGQYARTQAVSTGTVYRLHVEVSGTYYLTVQRGTGFIELGNDFGRRFQLPEGAEARWDAAQAPGIDYIQFFPDGRIEAPQLELTDASGQVLEIGCRSETELLTVIQRETR